MDSTVAAMDTMAEAPAFKAEGRTDTTGEAMDTTVATMGTMVATMRTTVATMGTAEDIMDTIGIMAMDTTAAAGGIRGS